MKAENIVGQAVYDAAFAVHRELGPGLLESVYERALAYELTKRGFRVECQQVIDVSYDGQPMGQGFRADLIVEGLVLVEVKSIEAVAPVIYKVVTTYLKLSGIKLGYLINFREEFIKDGIRRIVIGL